MAAGVSATPAVACRGLSVRHGEVVALDRLDLVVERGETVAVLGPSGAGKTTLLHAVAGFVPLSAGSVHIDGAEVGSPARVTPPERRRVGVVFQQYALWPHMTAVATVAYPLRRRGLDAREATRAALDLLDRMGVADLADRRPAEMSGGQQQRVGVARALAASPRLMLLDEPFAALDPLTRDRLQQSFLRIRRQLGLTSIFVTHDMGEALLLGDRIAVMREGRLVQVGTPLELVQQPADDYVRQLMDTPRRQAQAVEALLEQAAP
jgi:osmoprotectant transport system ATP-binding protein